MPDFAFFGFDVGPGGVNSITIVLPQLFMAEASMLDADFWLDQAMMFRQQANSVRDPEEREELRTLAQICDAVASKIEEHFSGG
ncbi:MAG TPA: hypothetical protein VN656_01055 [Stellaceae bacterium]|jgi:hypothetical protein|nr:hypothetical protein [Stellaceae bacterium]